MLYGVCLWLKNLLNSMRNEEENRSSALYFAALQGVKNLRNLARKTVEENLMLIGDRDELSGSTA